MPQANRLKLPTKSAKQQAAGRILWNESRSTDGADFFTFGYTGRKTNDLLQALVDADVRTLVDIRQHAVSMYRPDLSKENLRRLIADRGMNYVHLPELGVPRDVRAKAVSTGSRDVIWNWYDEYVVRPYVGVNLHRFFNEVEHPAAFMCTETDPTECHRHRLCLALEQHGFRSFDL